MTHVLVATDGSEQSLKAVRYLRDLLKDAAPERVSIIAVVRPLAANVIVRPRGRRLDGRHAIFRTGVSTGWSTR